MLRHLVIQHLAIVDRMELDFHKGFSVITGETGSGKSILTDALHFVCGARGETQRVQQGSTKASISARFQVLPASELSQWLNAEDLLDVDDPQSLIVHRTLTKEGRSRVRINGHPTTVAKLKSLGQRLLGYQSQHAQHRLGQSNEALVTLDAYHDNQWLIEQTRQSFAHWQGLQKQLRQLQVHYRQAQAEQALLAYQLAELKELEPTEQELATLESERMGLAHAEDNLLQAQRALTLSANTHEYANAVNARSQLLQTQTALAQIQDDNPLLENIHTLAQQSLTLVDELAFELQTYIQQFAMNPERLQWIDTRLNHWYRLARKHQCAPRDLFQRYQQLQVEQTAFEQQPDIIAETQQRCELAQAQYRQHAEQLSQARHNAAMAIEQGVQALLPDLDLPDVRLEIRLEQAVAASETGIDQVVFWVRTNPGQPMLPLADIASGGEMARLYLALEAVCAEQQQLPILVFDEVDVGVGGATAERMGRLLKRLSQRSQVVCITHQPQVAALGEHHLQILKRVDQTDQGEQTRSLARYLSPKQRVQELTRMLGGITKTQTTRQHAEALLLADAG